jgi:DNA adenine methylase
LPYLGGKQALVPRLLPLIPEHVCYVEVFGGAAALLLNKPASSFEVYNDYDSELVNLFEVIRDDVDAFVKKADWLLYSRELNEKWKKDLRNGILPEDKVERALRFWYVMRSSFAAHPYKGWAFAKRKNRSRPRSIINAIASIRAIHDRLRTVEIDHLDFRRCIKNRDARETFMFLDPPYLDATEYRLGIFTLHDHTDLAGILRHAKSKWLMTIGDHPKIRALYHGFPINRVKTHETVSKIIGGKRPTFKQLIIRNYEPPKTPLYVPVAGRITVLDLFGVADQGNPRLRHQAPEKFESEARAGCGAKRHLLLRPYSGHLSRVLGKAGGKHGC